MTDPAPKPIADCPNPECRSPCSVCEFSDGGVNIACDGPDDDLPCGYEGPTAFSKAEAIRLHNLICRPSAGEDVKASPVVPVEKMQKLYDELHEDAKHMYPTDESLDNGCPMTVDEGEAWAFGIARSRIAQLIKEAKGG